MDLSTKEEQITSKFCSGDGKPPTVEHILVNTDDKLSSHGWDNHGCLELTHIEKISQDV